MMRAAPLAALAALALAFLGCGGGNYRPAGALDDRRPPPVVAPRAGAAESEAPPARPLKRKRRPLADPTELRLTNGVRVLFLEEHDFPAATVGFILDRGAAAAPPGVAELYAQAIRGGSTKSASAKDNRGELTWLGAQISSHASQDSVSLTVTAISALLPQLVPHVCAMATTATFDDDSLGDARATARSAALHMREDPETIADIALRPLLFPDRHPYGFVPSASNPARFSEMSKNELENFRDMYVAADRLTVVVSGDVKPPMLLPRLEQCLAGVARKKGAAAPSVPAAAAPSKPRIVLVPRAGASQANIELGFMGVRRSDPSLGALLVLESLLGRSLSGRMNLTIRAEHGYSYGVHMRTRAWRDGGMIAVSTSANTANAVDTVRGLLSELQRVQSQPISVPELERAKLHAGARVAADAGDNGGGLSLLAALGLPLRHYEDLAQSIERITEADLQAAATKAFGTSVQMAIVGDPSLADPLRALGVGEVTLRRE